jgi:hypothetical protein
MLSDKEDLPTTSEDHNIVGIAESGGQHSHVFFDSKDLVESFTGDEFIHKNDLSAILNHAMTSITGKSKDGFLWFTFK